MSSDVHFTCERSHALINSPVKFDAGLSSDAELMCELSLLRGLDQHRPHLPQLYHHIPHKLCRVPLFVQEAQHYTHNLT